MDNKKEPLSKRFRKETEDFIASYLKAKNIPAVAPEASKPIDVDAFLNFFDKAIEED
jgi:hypothetical protein